MSARQWSSESNWRLRSSVHSTPFQFLALILHLSSTAPAASLLSHHKVDAPFSHSAHLPALLFANLHSPFPFLSAAPPCRCSMHGSCRAVSFLLTALALRLFCRSIWLSQANLALTECFFPTLPHTQIVTLHVHLTNDQPLLAIAIDCLRDSSDAQGFEADECCARV